MTVMGASFTPFLPSLLHLPLVLPPPLAGNSAPNMVPEQHSVVTFVSSCLVLRSRRGVCRRCCCWATYRMLATLRMLFGKFDVLVFPSPAGDEGECFGCLQVYE
ncbi:hypothetical protein E2C01_052056 [Portunus trituberculatus]|uniref:Secreted protein n=1 Tax=Portunus trituberculatus TaxID=210409 RepID=A0A5B7GGJ9_PORTR|nr:hypothetical protein [Portunus trituberculatus]